MSHGQDFGFTVYHMTVDVPFQAMDYREMGLQTKGLRYPGSLVNISWEMDVSQIWSRIDSSSFTTMAFLSNDYSL